MQCEREIDFSEVSIVIPAFNEEEGIERTLRELLNDSHLERAEIIVVNDASTDNTEKIVNKIEKEDTRVKLINHNQNYGYGHAIATGVKKSDRQYVVWYDADGQHQPKDLVALVDKAICEEWDYGIGIRGADSYVDKSRVFGKTILKIVLGIISNGLNTDFNSGLRIFKRKILEKYLVLLPERFGASTVTTLLMAERGYFGGGVPITVRQRTGVSSVRQVRDGFRTIALACNIIVLFRPMRIFGPLGILSILIGSIYGIGEAIINGLGIPTLAVIIITFGLQIFFFGIISSQISAARKENLERS